MVAKAEEDPKAAARAIGNAGNAGTNLPERGIGASRLEDEGRARLADPDDPGGAAGRTVIRGTTSRPAESVPATDPLVRRSETIAASPQSSVHGADGLASGSTADCGATSTMPAMAGRAGPCAGASAPVARPYGRRRIPASSRPRRGSTWRWS